MQFMEPKPTKSRIWAAFALTLLLAQLSIPTAWAVPQRASISAFPVILLPNENFNLRISGRWDNSCIPEFERLDQIDGALIIHTTSAESNCLVEESNYQFEIQPGSEFSGLFQKSGVVPIKLFWRPDSSNLARLHAFALQPVAGNTPANPETGMWWAKPGSELTTSGPGIGFSFEIQNQQLAMLSNLYDSQGAATWFLSSGTINENVMSADLVALEGGQSLFGDYAPPQPVANPGQVHLQFHGHASATAWFTTAADPDVKSELLLHPIELTRYVFASSGGIEALAGRWALSESFDQARITPSQIDLRVQGAAKSVLADVSSNFQLRCTSNRALTQITPSRCQMSDTQGGLYEFDNIGLNQMSGINPNGLPVTLVRLPDHSQ